MGEGRDVAVGVDAGATLAKIAVRGAEGAPGRGLLPAQAVEEIGDAIARLGATRVGLTGGGAAALQARLAKAAPAPETVRVDEFAAWGSGAALLLRRQEIAVEEPYLLVSLGTGTSVLLVDGLSVRRVGGTALGGGTVVGLASLALGTLDFGEIARLAARGDRGAVDLLVSDVYRAGEFALAGDLTAANFGRLARAGGGSARREDLAHAIMGLVGENVALVCAGLALPHGVRRVVFAGSTLRDNSALQEVLSRITAAFGREAVVLEGGEFAGAVGALQLAAGDG